MRIAVLGLGFMGSTHLKAWKSIPGVELVAVSSDEPEKLTGDLSSVQGNIGGPGEKYDFSNVRKYIDYRDALQDTEIDAYDVCLPTHLHAPAAVGALQSGRHVLVEKPMGLTADDVDGMLAAAAGSGRVLMTAQVLRFFPAYEALREKLKTLGPVRTAFFRRRCAAPAWARWSANAALSGGGVFDLVIHDVDMCIHLFGEPEAVSAEGYEDMPKGIDWISGRLHYPGIATVEITGGWHHPKAYPFSMEYTVVAEEGTVDYCSAFRAPTLYTSGGEEQVLALPEKDGYHAEIEYFLECARACTKPKICPPEESAAAVKLTRLMVQARNHPGQKLAAKA